MGLLTNTDTSSMDASALPHAGKERRRHARNVKQTPVQIHGADGVERVAMSADLSDGGMLLGTPHRFVVGETLKLQTMEWTHPREGSVIRIERNEGAETALWRYRVALRFSTERPS